MSLSITFTNTWSLSTVRLVTCVFLFIRVGEVGGLKCFQCAEVKLIDTNTNRKAVIPISEVSWRDDGRCGPDFLLNTTREIAQCDPDKGNNCCSGDGWCGSSTKHCCLECTKYERSFDDFDLPLCSGSTTADCPEDADAVCISVKIATNTSLLPTIDRHQTLRRCGTRLADKGAHCHKYRNAGHSCRDRDVRQCSRNRCNGDQNVRIAGGLVISLIMVLLLG